MSMILDALTRAEQERQLESQPNLKFVTPVKQRRKTTSRAWVWITAALIANAVVLAFILYPSTRQSEQTQIVFNESVPDDVNKYNPQSMVENSIESIREESKDSIEYNADTSVRSLASEVGPSTKPQLDRALIYEAKQHLENTAKVKIEQNNENIVVATTTPKKGTVSFSKKELSLEAIEQSIPNAPKLLIKQGVVESPEQVNTSHIPKLKDLPLSSRDSLSKFEVNVHVYDDKPDNRFVLINMDKYKEGDRISNNGPLVEEITRKGVVVDYGSGKALLPPK